MTLVPLPALADNYLWMLHDGFHAIGVDPEDAKSVFDARASSALQLAAILVMHHHADRAGRPQPRCRMPLFLRSREATVIAAVPGRPDLSATAGGADVFSARRPWKNDFR